MTFANNDDTAVLSTLPAEPDSDDPRDDILAQELAKVAPRKWWNRATIVLGAVVLLIGGFVGGLHAQKQWGVSSTNAGGPAGSGNFPGGGGAGRPGAGGNGAPSGGTGQQGAPAAGSTTAAAGTTGTVKLVDGSTIYVQAPNGDVVTVKTDGKTSVSTASKGKISDVKAGQSITVRGTTGSDGAVTATSVTAVAK